MYVSIESFGASKQKPGAHAFTIHLMKMPVEWFIIPSVPTKLADRIEGWNTLNQVSRVHRNTLTGEGTIFCELVTHDDADVLKRDILATLQQIEND